MRSCSAISSGAAERRCFARPPLRWAVCVRRPPCCFCACKCVGLRPTRQSIGRIEPCQCCAAHAEPRQKGADLNSQRRPAPRSRSRGSRAQHPKDSIPAASGVGRPRTTAGSGSRRSGPVRRRSNAQLLRELCRVGERQQRRSPGFVTADAQLQRRRARKGRGGWCVGENSRRVGRRARRWRCRVQRDHPVRPVVRRRQRRAAASLQVTAIAIAVGGGPVEAQIPDGGVARRNLRQQCSRRGCAGEGGIVKS